MSAEKEKISGWWLLAIIPLGIWWLIQDSYIMLKIWEWYAIPLGAPVVDRRAFIGLSLIAAVIRVSPRQPREADSTFGMHVAGSTLKPWLVLLFAWIGKGLFF